MATIDSRVVEMNFDGSKFGSGVEKTLGMLDRLKSALSLNGASKGLQDVNAAAQGFNSGPMEQGAGRIAGQFTAMQAIALGALTNIGAKAVQIGTQVVNSLTLAPVMQGFQEYETNMNSIQTILSNTRQAGTGLTEVNAALDEMNLYSDKTIYNFSEMARNVGTFTAAGVDLDTATGSIKGIANLAAMSGSNSQQAAGAMYQLSQEIAAGKVTLMGWNSVVNAGMGGSVFQRALAETAVAMGKIDQSSLKLEGDMKNVVINGKAFRDSISAANGQESWLTSDVLTNTLQQFTGDLSDAELAAQGFSEAQIQAIKEQAAAAVGAATEVKTFSGLMDTLKEGVASGWSQTFRILIGDFEEAKTLFTNISNTVGGFLGGISEGRNKMLQEWKALGGRTELIAGLGNMFAVFGRILGPIAQAFRSIFPPTTAQGLMNFTTAFNSLMQDLIPGIETVDRIRRTAAGFFAIFGIGWEVIKAVAKFLLDMFRGIDEGDKGILRITATIGDWLVALQTAIKNGEGLTKFFDGLRGILFKIINPIKDFGQAIGYLFEGDGTGTSWSVGGAAGAGLEKLRAALAPLGRLGDLIATGWGKLLDAFSNLVDVFEPLGNKISEFFSNIGSWFSNAFGNMDYEKIMQALQVGLSAGLLLVLRNLASSIGDFSLFGGEGGGFLDTLKDGADAITGAIEGVTDTLGAMQASLKASALMKIAAAIALLAAALWVIASIDSNKLTSSLTAMAVMFTMLGASMAAFAKIATPMQIIKVNLMGAAMILLATAILILASAVKKLADLDNKGLRDGLIAVTVLIFSLTQASKGLNGQAKKMVATGAGLILMAVAINILADAVEQIGGMRWQDIAQGVIATGVLLRALATFTQTVGDNMNIKTGVGLILLAAGIKIVASAVKDLEDMRWQDMVQGVGTLAVMLRAMANAISAMPKDAAAKGLALLILAAGLKLMASAIKDMEDMRWQDMVQGVGTLSAMLSGMARALSRLPPGTMLNAVGILIVAASLKLIADAVESMQDMRWQDMVQGVGSLAIMLSAMARAISKLPAGAIFSAAAIFVVASSLGLIADALGDIGKMSTGELAQSIIGLSMALRIIAGATNSMIGALPGAAAILVVAAALWILQPVLQAFGEMSLGEMIKSLGMLAGVFIVLGLAGLILTPVVPIILLLGIAIGVLAAGVFLAGAGIFMFSLALTALAASGAAGTAAIVAIVSGLIGLIPLVMEQIGLGIIAFANVIATAGPAILGAITAVLNAFLQAIIDVTPKVVEALLVLLFNFLTVLDQAIPRIIQTGIRLLMALLDGIGRNIGQIVDKAVTIVVNFVNAIANNLPRIIQAGINLILALMNGIGEAARSNGPRLADAAMNMAEGIISGLVSGVRRLGSRFKDALLNLASQAWEGIKDFFGIGSPSKLMIWTSKQNVEGLVVGLDKYGHRAVDATEGMGYDIVNTLGKTISGLGDLVSGDVDMTPVITPVLDLTDVRNSASGIGALLAAEPLNVGASYSSAANAAVGYRNNQTALEGDGTGSENDGLTFIQNNYSPKAISSIETYRNTRSQLSVAKEALKTNAD